SFGLDSTGVDFEERPPFFAGPLAGAAAVGCVAAFLARGGGLVGTGIGPLASGEAFRAGAFFALPFLASRTARRLVSPRTGLRGRKIHPTCSTGLPPIRRPSSNSHGYCPWNSWKE